MSLTEEKAHEIPEMFEADHLTPGLVTTPARYSTTVAMTPCLVLL